MSRTDVATEINRKVIAFKQLALQTVQFVLAILAVSFVLNGHSISRAQDSLASFVTQPVEDAWEVNTGPRPEFTFSCERVDEAFFAPVIPVAQAESIRRLETSPFTSIGRSDAFRLLGLPDPGRGTALIDLLTRAIDELESQKKVHLSWSVSDQDRLDSLIAQRQNPVLMPYLVRATGYDAAYTDFSIAICGDTIWLASRSPNIPDTTVKRFPLVIFLERPPTNLYLTRGVLGKNPSR